MSKLHKFKINERERDNGRASYLYYVRRFWTWYGVGERGTLSAHLDILFRKNIEQIFAISFRIDPGSDSRWAGHLTILWFSLYWGHSGFKKLSDWATRCKGYKYDSRSWLIRISDGSLWWEFADHSDMCRSFSSYDNRNRTKKNGKRKRWTWRRGSFNLSIPEMIWGPKRYTYETIDEFDTAIKMPEGAYEVTIKLQKQYLGRTRVPKHKHIMSWGLEVDSDKGIPSHYDKSGGWKGDRTYGFGVKFKYPRSAGWQQDAINAVTAWVYDSRARSGFREPLDVVEV